MIKAPSNWYNQTVAPVKLTSADYETIEKLRSQGMSWDDIGGEFDSCSKQIWRFYKRRGGKL